MRRARRSRPATVPTYALYGEVKTELEADLLHCEAIARRSARYGGLIKPHRHEDLFHLLHLTGGRSRLLTRNAVVELDPPGVILVPPRTVHGFEFPRSVRGHVITFNPEECLRHYRVLCRFLAELHEPCWIGLAAAGDRTAEIDYSVQTLASEFDSREPGRQALLVSSLVTALVRLWRLSGNAPVRFAPTRAFQQAERFRELVERDYRLHLPVASYATRLGITSTHLNRVCRQAFADTATGIIHQRLMLEARRALRFTVHGIGEIGSELGFEDAAYFSRFFTRHAGVSPRTFRRRAGAGT